MLSCNDRWSAMVNLRICEDDEGQMTPLSKLALRRKYFG